MRSAVGDHMNLIAITLPYFYRGESRDIAALIDSGRFLRVHIRKPYASIDEMCVLLNAIPYEMRAKITLHDCLELADEFGVGGVHLSGRHPKAPSGWQGLVSRSIHSVEEILESKEDYVFLSPVYTSISKPGYRGKFNLSDVSRYLNSKVYALGGVTFERLPEIKAAGFGGAAMLGAVWRRPIDIEQFSMQFITNGETPESVIEGAKNALAGGCRWVQVRMKDRPIEEVESVLKQLAYECHSHDAVLLVDDHVGIAANMDCVDGVHVGKNDMPVFEARRLLGPSKILGATANTFDDLYAAVKDGADYVGLGPFRFTATKKNLSPVLGEEGYREIIAKCDDVGIHIPVVAIGGITEKDVPSIMRAGARGIAVSSAILKAENQVDMTRMLVGVIRGLMK